MLEERMLVGPAHNDLGLVFATPIGTAIDPSNLRRTWMSVTRAVGIGRLRFHSGLAESSSTARGTDRSHAGAQGPRGGGSGISGRVCNANNGEAGSSLPRLRV